MNGLLSHVAMAGGFFALDAAGPGTIALFGGEPAGILAEVQYPYSATSRFTVGRSSSSRPRKPPDCRFQ